MPKASKRTKSDSSIHAVDIRQILESKSLPDYEEDIKPTAYLQALVESLYGYRPEVKTASTLTGYFPEVTEEQIAAYDMHVLNAHATMTSNASKASMNLDKRWTVAIASVSRCCIWYADEVSKMWQNSF